MVHRIGAGLVRCGISTGDGLDEVDKVETPTATSRWERWLSIREVATSGLRLHIPRLSGHCTARGARGGRGNASPVPPPTLPVRLLHVARDACLTRASRPTGGLRRQCQLNTLFRDRWRPRAYRNGRTFDRMCAPKWALLGARSGADSVGLRFILYKLSF